MRIAILAFEGFNKRDSRVAFGILKRIRRPGWKTLFACPAARITSMNLEPRLDPARSPARERCDIT